MSWRAVYEKIQRGLAWIGLLLMAASFVWLELLPSREQKAADVPVEKETFKLVIIDPGHGGEDSGASRDGLLEKELTLDVAQRLERLLQTQGLRTLLTRYGDEYISLPSRAAAANQERNCILVSIHFDEGSRADASGVGTFYAGRQMTDNPLIPSWLPFLQQVSSGVANVDSQNLAGFIQKSLVTWTQAINRGTKGEQFFVIANVRHPAVLVEGGFLSNKDDVAKLSTAEYREQIATAISDGILRYRDAMRQGLPVAVSVPEN